MAEHIDMGKFLGELVTGTGAAAPKVVRVSLRTGDPESDRLLENERAKVWEEGFLAGLHTVNGEHQKNPYHWRGPAN